VGPPLDRRLRGLCGEDSCLRLRRGDLLLGEFLLDILAQKARVNARLDVLQRADLARRGPPLRLRVPTLLASEEEAERGAGEGDRARRGGDREGVRVRRAAVRVGGDERGPYEPVHRVCG
jgi:hypothetical protein